MSPPERLESGELDSSLRELEALLLAPAPEALERAAELALRLRNHMPGSGVEALPALQRCRKLAQHAAGYYLNLRRLLEMRLGVYTRSGSFQGPDRNPWRLDARA